MKKIIVTNVKEYLPPIAKLLFTLAKEKKEGHRPKIGKVQNTYLFQDLLKKNEARGKYTTIAVDQSDSSGAAIMLSTHILEIAQTMCDRIGIINKGQLIAVGTMDELRTLDKTGQTSLEDIFLNLTGGAEETEIAEILK